MNLDPDKLIKAIDRRIEFWRQPQADARVAQSVMVALAEVKEAIREATAKRKARPMLCKCGFVGNTRNIRQHRVQCPEWALASDAKQSAHERLVRWEQEHPGATGIQGP